MDPESAFPFYNLPAWGITRQLSNNLPSRSRSNRNDLFVLSVQFSQQSHLIHDDSSMFLLVFFRLCRVKFWVSPLRILLHCSETNTFRTSFCRERFPKLHHNGVAFRLQTQITSNQAENESTKISTNPIPDIEPWSICTPSQSCASSQVWVNFWTSGFCCVHLMHAFTKLSASTVARPTCS